MLQRAVRLAIRMEPVDVAMSAFASLLTLAGLLRFGALDDRTVVLRMAVLALVPLGIGALRARNPEPGRALSLLFDFYIAGTIVVMFDGLGPLIRAVNPHDQDAALIAFDRALFGVDPTVALERFARPFLSDVLTFCYALYYFYPIVLGGLIFADDRRRGLEGRAREFRRFAFTIVNVFFVSYALYFAVPAIGPRYTIQHAGPLPRGPVSRAIDETLDKLEKNKRDCFPSGHTMVVTAVLIDAARRSRKTFLGFLPFALGLIAATVYARYHYVADVLAGLALGIVTVPLARAVLAALDRRRDAV